MACVQGVSLTFIMLMIISMVKGRWLELDAFSALPILDGIHDPAYVNPPNLRIGSFNSSVSSATRFYAEKKCESVYGFLPCGDTIQEGVFLMLMYTYLMMLGEEWIYKGSEALFVLLGDKAIGGSVFGVLMALPRIVIVIVSGVLSTPSDAQNQVAFGVSFYAGSTVITLTLIWGLSIISSRDKLRGKGSTPECEHEEDSSTKFLFLKQKLSVLTNTGVNIDKETGEMAIIMLLSLIPFVVVQLVTFLENPITIFFAVIVSCVSLLLYFAYQIGNPWIQVRSLAYLKQENLRTRFFYHVQRLAEDDLIDEHGNPNLKAFESIFRSADLDNDGCISHDELEHLIQKVFELEKDNICSKYAKAEILTHFDNDKSGNINWLEFKKGCNKWLAKWKNVANTSNSISRNLWKQVEKTAIKKKRASITQIEKIMPRILRQVFEKHELLKEDGEPDRERIERLFSNYDQDSDNEVHKDELKQFIETVTPQNLLSLQKRYQKDILKQRQTLHFGVALDHDTLLDELITDFDKDGNRLIEKNEFVEGFIKWIRKATDHEKTIKDPKQAIAKFEEDCWAEIDSPMNIERPKSSIIYVILGIGLIYLISEAFIDSVIEFSVAAHIPFLLTSFVMSPLAFYGRMVIMALLNGRPNVSKNASLTFSKIYSGLVMNNLLGLSTLLTTVYIKGLSWTYSEEVLTIMIPCAIVGLFAFKRDTYPIWASICAMLLYPILVFVYYVLDS